MDVDAESLIDALRTDGLRITAARRAVCEVLAASHDEHLRIADVHARAERRAGASIDPSTVYRTIDVLERLDRIHHVHFGHGPSVVHLADHDPHHHLVCESCGRTVDLPVDEIAAFLQELEHRYGFSASSSHFALAGTCQECREQSENNAG